MLLHLSVHLLKFLRAQTLRFLHLRCLLRRMQENITRFGGVAVVVEDDWGTAGSFGKVEQTNLI
jgi:hypothetical protein